MHLDRAPITHTPGTDTKGPTPSMTQYTGPEAITEENAADAIRAAVEVAGREARPELVALIEQTMRLWFTRLDWMEPVEFQTMTFVALATVEHLLADELESAVTL